MKRVSVLVIIAALIAGLVGCPSGPQYSLTISSTVGGSVTTPGEGTFTYGQGTAASLVATPVAGFRFVEWTGDVGTIADVGSRTTTIAMNGDYSVIANFVAVHSLTIIRSAGGSVTAPGEGTFIYDELTVVNLVAEADQGYRFLNWIGDVEAVSNESAASTTITMDGDYSIGAVFAEYLKIWDWHGLYAIRHDLGNSYLLMSNLDASTAGYLELASTTANGGKGWEPVGVYGAEFTGSLNGQGYEIRDLFVERSDESEVALFGRVGAKGLIEDIGIMNVTVTGRHNVATLAGFNSGTVRGARSGGRVVGDSYVGGLVAYNTAGGTVQDSCSTADVIGTGDAGGLTGYNGGLVIGSWSSGSVIGGTYAGGLVGRNAGMSPHISDCWSSGTVTGEAYVGGLVGFNGSLGIVSTSYSTGAVTGQWNFGGLIGDSHGAVGSCFWDVETSGMVESARGTGRPTAEMRNIVTFLGAGWSIVTVTAGETSPTYTWNIVDGQTYPFLSWQPVS